MGQGRCTDLVLGHCTHDDRAHHTRQRAHAVGDAHKDTGVAWSNVQVVHVEPWGGKPGGVTLNLTPVTPSERPLPPFLPPSSLLLFLVHLLRGWESPS